MKAEQKPYCCVYYSQQMGSILSHFNPINTFIPLRSIYLTIYNYISQVPFPYFFPNSICIFNVPVRATHTVHPILLHPIAVVIFGKEKIMNILKTSLMNIQECNFLQRRYAYPH
jgi:hypothetical protein